NNSGSYYTFTITSSDLTPPVISNVTQDIDYPTDIQTVNITCRVTDENGIGSVQLVYRIQGGTWSFVLMNLLQGNTYFVIIGPFALGSFVEYFIQATDNSPNQNQGINSNEGDFFSFHVDPFPTYTSKLFMVPIVLAITSLIFIRKKK
ncbi:MAG: hypothetical protein ACTSQF_16300, partial [Candidatus Heimdallarchaeaceae archaeon]